MANQDEKMRHRLRRQVALRFEKRRYKLIVAADWSLLYYKSNPVTKLGRSKGYLRKGHVSRYSILGSKGKTRRKAGEYGVAYRPPVRDLRRAAYYPEG